jgi:ligand-binding sensor domain-containing protein/anti-sigma regulatory factor (Ser/Thr protein kinase)
MMLQATAGYAQRIPDIKFTHITSANGLSTQYIRSIFQDSRGLIWICTTAGLNRYDGNSFKIYRNIAGDPNSLPNDDVWRIVEDKKGNYWVGTQTGLCYFEPNENRFTNYFHQPGNTNSLAYSRAENLAIDKNGNIWIGSLNGLQQFNPLTKQFHRIEFATKKELLRVVDAQHVYSLYIDNRQQLWAQAGGNLYLINTDDISYKKILGRWSGNLGVNSIYQDHEDQYWVCYWGKGFARFDGRHEPADKDFITINTIVGKIAEWKDAYGHWWIAAIKDDGIYFYDKITGELRYYNYEITDPNSMGGHTGIDIISGTDNNLWIATNSGLDIVEPGKQFFNYHRLGEKKDREDYYRYGTPMPVYRDGNYYWVGLWHARGLLKLDSNWKQIKKYTSIPPGRPQSPAATIYSIHKEAEGIYWISTDESLVRFDEKNEQFKTYLPTDINPETFEFRKILAFGKNRLLVRTRHNGVYVFDKPSGKFENHFTKSGKEKLPDDDANDMVLDKNGALWIATSEGFCKLDTATLKITETYRHEDNNAGSVLSNFCWAIDVDANNYVWIGTQKGLSRFDPVRKTFTNYTTTDGLSNSAITKLITDKNNNIWMNTQNGVSVYRQDRKMFQNFYKEDGLPQNSLEGKFDKDKEGTIYMTDPGVVITVDPDNIPYNSSKPTVIITDAMVKDKHCAVRLNGKGEKYLDTEYGNSSFSVNFAVLNYNSPTLNRYYYKLEGIDKEWHQSDRGIASYINIGPGNYTLRVKGSNNSGVMNEEGDLIRVIVHPAWYQENWFKAILLVLIGAMIYAVYRWRVNAVRKKALFKQKMAETEMQALRAQMNPHFIFNSLNSIENFIMQNEKRLASDYLNKFSSLVRSILDSSRNELVPLTKDMEALQLYIDLEQLRFNNKFTYKTQVDAQLLGGDHRVPSLLVQPYVENAIVHGLAHSEKKDLYVHVTAVLENDYIRYIVEDNGIGREKAGSYNLQNKPYHKSVGMKITQDRIHIFNERQGGQGEIVITDLYDENKQGAGTRVSIKIKAV